MDGITVQVDTSRPPYERLLAVHVGEELLDLDRDYLVGTIDMFTFGSGYLSLSRGKQIVYMLPEFIRDVLADQLQDEAAIASSHNLRFTDVVRTSTKKVE
ncbi:hypothetical protein D3C86_2049620 [compost metagenome]